MTKFLRRGHERTLSDGSIRWVEAAIVRRENWDRTLDDYTPPTPPKGFLFKHPEFNTPSRFSKCFVTPNARCPVCGKHVYYYENIHGSRVFFDELGPPWPKHPCTDSRLKFIPSGEGESPTNFSIRNKDFIDEITQWQIVRGINFEAEFQKEYEIAPWPLATIAKRMKSGKRVFLVLHILQAEGPKKVYLSCRTLSKCCKAGTIVAIHRQKISFIDTATLSDREIAIKRYRSAAAFLDAMIEPT